MKPTPWPRLLIHPSDQTEPFPGSHWWVVEGARVGIPVVSDTDRRWSDPGHISEWDEVPLMFCVDEVIDRRPFGERSPDSIRALIRCLSPHGTYRAMGSKSEIEHIIQDRDSLSSAAFEQYTRAVSLEVSQGGDWSIAKKNCASERVIYSAPLDQVASGAITSFGPGTYSRIVPRLEVPKSMSSALERFTENYGDASTPAAKIAILDDALVTGYGQIVYDGVVIEESFVHNFHLRNRGQYYGLGRGAYQTTAELQNIPRERVIDEPCIVVKQTWDSNYGHWLVDTFSRIAALEGLVDLSEVKFLLNSPHGPIREVMLESMRLIGVDESQIIFSGTQTWRLRQAMYVTPFTRAPLIKHPESIRFLEGLSDAARRMGGKNFAPNGRIYLTRGHFGKRRLVNEEELTPSFHRGGYAIISPERLTLADQIVTFSQAARVVGVMGAGFTNLAFCAPGVKALLLATQKMQHDYFYDLVCHKGGRYVGVQGRALDPNAGLASDFDVDVAQVLRVACEEGFLTESDLSSSI